MKRRSGTQENDIHDVFKRHGYGVWIPLPEFPHQHEFNRAIHNLRNDLDLNIRNKTERSRRADGRPRTDSFYRLLPGKWSERHLEPKYPERREPEPPAKSWEQVCEERDRKLAAEPVFELQP